MLIFSGLQAEGIPFIYGYIIDYIDPTLYSTYEYSVTYNSPSAAIIEEYEEIEHQVTLLTGESMQ